MLPNDPVNPVLGIFFAIRIQAFSMSHGSYRPEPKDHWLVFTYSKIHTGTRVIQDQSLVSGRWTLSSLLKKDLTLHSTQNNHASPRALSKIALSYCTVKAEFNLKSHTNENTLQFDEYVGRQYIMTNIHWGLSLCQALS